MSKTSKKNRRGSKTPNKTIEEKYQKKDLHEHILDLPDSYIGSIEEKICHMWVYNENARETDAKMIYREINYVPGFYKICDEIFVNAADHSNRCKSCNKIKIDIDQKEGIITVWNNGDGIDVVENKDHKILVPTMLFCDLLTSTNYDQDEEKTVGGKNGFGAKLANIYSTEFEVETLDAARNLKFRQKCTNNMYTKGTAKITPGNGKKPYTKISFIPDFEKFGLDGITDDMLALLKKRAYDMAMSTKSRIYFNGKLIAQNNFANYVDLYFPEGSEHEKVFDTTTHKRWKVCAVYDKTDQLEHQNISFVNSICTSRGGTHVEHVVGQVVKNLTAAISKKVKNLQIKPALVKENLLFFVDSTIVNPVFDTQTKECLTTKPANFGSNFTVTDAFIRKITKTGVVEQIIANAQAKAEANLSKTDGKGKGAVRLEKLYNAHKAGTKEGYKCTLILTEGDSAKTFAMSGLNVVGRDYYGVFPLRGKLLNVRDAKLSQIENNEEIIAIKQIMGLQKDKVYHDNKGLRYGNIMVLADQDTDGYHIKGLVMNFIHYYWPSLIKQEGFIQSFATHILKATKGKGKNKQVIEFTNLQEFEDWKKENDDGKGWKIKYYKGLGTSKASEAQACFTNLDDKIARYFWEAQRKGKNDTDKETKKKRKKPSISEFIDEETDMVSETYKPKMEDMCEDAITLAFTKNRANDRKKWVSVHDPNNYIDSREKKISYYDFIHKELIFFSVEDNVRSIPNIMDGFKPSQRKVYFGSILENIYNEEIRVSELAGSISKKTKYHHGEKSMTDTIINMAQNYVGSNNLNLLLPIGQYGSRLCGGQDHASPRYINTRLNELGKKIFIEEDNYILQQNIEDNQKIEPVFYAPIIPMILVNGTAGIGTGFSSNIEPCDPRDIYNNIKRIIAGGKPKSMKPWYRHFKGTVDKIDTNKFISRAKYVIIDDNTIHITDLPIGVWTDNYKHFLDNLINEGSAQKKKDKQINTQKSRAGSKSRKSRAGSKSQKINDKKGSKNGSSKKGSSNKNGSNKNGSNKKGSGKKGSKASKKYLAKKSERSATAKVSKTNPIASSIKNYTEDCTEIRISFTIMFHPGKLKTFIKNGTLEKNLKLAKTHNLSNMHLFNEHGQIKKYESYGAILNNFAKVRLELYQKRKDFLLEKWLKEIDMLKWKLKFVEGVVNDEIIVFKKKTAEIIAQLEELGFPKFTTSDKKKKFVV